MSNWDKHPYTETEETPSSNVGGFFDRLIHFIKRSLWYSIIFAMGSMGLGLLSMWTFLAVVSNGSAVGLTGLLSTLPIIAIMFFIAYKIKPYLSSKSTPPPAASFAEQHSDELEPLHTLWKKGQVYLNGEQLKVFNETVFGIRAAFKALGEEDMSRELFDIRQAIAEDLPRVLDLYLSTPRSQETDSAFIENNHLIAKRMQNIVELKRKENLSGLHQNAAYLKEKYGHTENDWELPNSEPYTPFPDLHNAQSRNTQSQLRQPEEIPVKNRR